MTQSTMVRESRVEVIAETVAEGHVAQVARRSWIYGETPEETFDASCSCGWKVWAVRVYKAVEVASDHLWAVERGDAMEARR